MIGGIVKKHAARIGKQADARGLSESQMMQITGHRSSAQLRGYIQDAELFSVNVSAAIGL